MKTIMVATDFSARSDRAIRRATLLAKTFDAAVTLVHVVDDDQPAQVVRAEQAMAASLLREQAASLREIDAIACDVRVVLGDPFEGLVKAAADLLPDLLVVGPHRRQTLRDVFVGTTAERTIRSSPLPVLMANGVPAQAYRRVLVAVDLRDCAADVVRCVAGLGLDRHAAVLVAHVFETPGASLLAGASMTAAQLDAYLSEEQARAAGSLATFLRDQGFAPTGQIAKRSDGTTAGAILAIARETAANLIVVGTSGQTGVARLLLGSVAEEVLRRAACDILAVPAGIAVPHAAGSRPPPGASDI